MIENNDKEFEIKIASSSISSLFNDDIERQILSPLSCLREYGTHWLLEFDLPLVNKKDIKVTFDEKSINVEAKLKETYSEEKLVKKQNLNILKRLLHFQGKLITKKLLQSLKKAD